MTDTVGRSGNSSLLPTHSRGLRRSSEFPSLQLNPEPRPPPVHDQAPGEAAWIGRDTCRSGQCGACGVEPGRTYGVDRAIIEVVAAAKWVREVRHGLADRPFQHPLGAGDRVLLLPCRAICKPHVLDRVGTDRRGV